ncbi:hypothetical protein TSAR_005944 [Trichomalopsis sarcophagae]|uniref:WD repeat-containing protein 60 n=1 Tax=Trichomalopsis sarcophagae TaxID=543379 RepID=A0A232EYX2_9HYME|nr:hypothetical protein TSAR_005944 [Trichomalopsis sarcophagae]
MSSKGAIKKTTTESRSHTKSQDIKKTRPTRASSQDEEKKEKRKEPQIIDARAAGDRKSRTGAALAKKNVLPDKNPVKLKQLKQNGLVTSKPSSHEFASSATKKSLPPKSKSESSSKTTAPKVKSSVSKTTKDKVQAQYSEKRGESSRYVPKDAAAKLKETTSSERRRSKDKSSMPKSSEKPSTSNSSEKASTSRSSAKASTSKAPDKTLPRHSSRERKRSRTLSPSEVKVLHSPNQKENSQSKEGEEEDANNAEDDKYNYEDDFEEYESDFEEYISDSQIDEESDSLPDLYLEPIVLRTEEKKRTINSADIRTRQEEESMLDSGHYELTEAKKRAAMVESLMATRMKTPPPPPEVKDPANHSYREEKQSENKSLPSSTDEGFEDARSGDFTKSPPMSQISVLSPKKPKVKRVVEEPPKILTRGQVLMSMIKLDTVELSLFESPPISYEEFIRSYGTLNTQQISTQTNEDNLDVETQTDTSEVENKWTQFPVKCKNNLETIEDVRLFKIEQMGVGGDKPDYNALLTNPSYDTLKLNEFLSKAGKVVLALLEEKEFGGNILQSETHEFPFSEGFIKLSVSSLSFLCGRQVSMLHYSEMNNKILMSIHAPANEKIEPSCKQDYIMDSCIGCVWNVNEPSRPVKLFYSQSPITACCFHCTNHNIVFAGLQDGTVCLWDLREEETWHQRIIDKVNEMDWVVRTPTYTTAGNWEVEAHMSSVVAIRIISRLGQDEAETLSEKFVSIQICTLDEEGRLIIWSVLRNLSTNSDDLGLTQWGKVKLIKSQEVSLFAKRNEMNDMKKEFVDMNVDNVDSNNLYLATNDTNILYANCIGARNGTPYYKINEMDSCGSTTCIEVCPFKQSYFFAGCKDGSIRLHTLNIETPLLKLKDEDSTAGIKSIQWSKSKPLTVYVLDEYSRIVVWDLSNSDIHPTHTVSTKSWGYVKCMRLSPCNTSRDMLNQYMALGTDTGNVEVHKLKKDFFFSQQDDFLQEMNTFLRYVSIL